MASKRITDVQIRTWVRQGGPLSAKALGGGLYFRIHNSGAQQFYFRYRFTGKAKWHFLGNYPDTTLKAAREAAMECRVQVNKGIDPGLEKQRVKAQAMAERTFGEVADEWYQREILPKYKHPEVVERVLRKWVKPKVGNLPITEVGPAQADEVLQAIVDAGAPTVANDALRYMKRIFKRAKKRHIITINPVADFEQSDAGGDESGRERALSGEELGKLFAVAQQSESFGRSNELAIKLLLLLCVRKMELLAAKWEEFDLDTGLWHMPDNKSGRPVVIPLPSLAIAWLRELYVLACGSAYLFPVRRVSRQRRFPHVNPDTLNRALQELGHDIDHFTVHDLRRTARTHLGRLGVRSEVAERCLNHKIRGVEGTYDRHDYLDERRRALELWAAELETFSRVDNKVTVGAFGQS